MADSDRLPPLRDDLKLIPASPTGNTRAFRTLYDPARNRFFRLGPLETALLKRWPLGRAEAVVADVNAHTPYQATPDVISRMIRFCRDNQLLAPVDEETRSRLRALKRRKQGIGSWLLHHYIYIRIPLIHPDRFLTRTLPLARKMASRPALYLMGILVVIGLFLAARQWEAFKSTFLYFFTFRGMALYALAIFFSKALHELGHAYTAKHYGLKVPSMGAALILMWPICYTENSEGWKLAARGPRLRIVGAGVLTELVLAGLATLVWSFLPDGSLKSACFIIATVNWISSVFINLSPFMRFDGYYLLTDLLDFPNLQTRAFALGRWRLRRLLWGLKEPCPEMLPDSKRRFLIVYAYGTWLYRLMLFTGIALMVYHLFFKVLGMLLFAVEISWFLIAPVARELKVWRRHLSGGALNIRSIITLFILAVLLLLLALPIHSRIQAPAIIKAAAKARIYPPFAARIEAIMVEENTLVKRGDVLFRLADPALEWRERKVQNQIKTLQMQLEGGVSGGLLLEQHLVLRGRLMEARAQAQGLRERRQKLDIRAPLDGVVLDLAQGLHNGVWIASNQRLALVVDRGGAIIQGYLREEHLGDARPGDRALFFNTNDPIAPLTCTVATIDPTGLTRLEEPYLASVYGGPIAVRYSKQEGLVSQQSLYRITLTPKDPMPAPHRVMRGRVVINGRPQSLLKRAWIRIATVLIRESGF